MVKKQKHNSSCSRYSAHSTGVLTQLFSASFNILCIFLPAYNSNLGAKLQKMFNIYVIKYKKDGKTFYIFAISSIKNKFFALFCFPAKSACAKYGSIAVLQFRNEHLSLSLEDWHNILVIRIFYWVHDVLAALCQSAKEDECLWR